MLSILNTHWARTLLRQKSEAYSRLLVENLNHQVFIQFILPVAVRYGQIELRREEQKTSDEVAQVCRVTATKAATMSRSAVRSGASRKPNPSSAARP